MKKYITEMNMCIELAKKAQGMTSPNPLVGCVILNPEGKIVSTGYHKKCGQNHAERDALLKKENFKDCTLIVNLEPCVHYGKTPPCTDLIIEKGIKTVVYGMQDPNPVVSSKGIQKLKNVGIKVIGPVLEEECKKLNEIFIKNQTKKQTFVALKTASTLDGKIAAYTNDSKWITCETSRKEVRNIRKKYDAILTSSSTIIADNPQMKHNCKIILDRELKTDPQSQIYKQGKIYLFHHKKQIPENFDRNITFIQTPVINNKLDIEFILKKLYELNITSVLVEAGGVLNGSFIDFADKIYQFIAPKILGDNMGKSCFSGKSIEKISQCANFKTESVETVGTDVLITYVR